MTHELTKKQARVLRKLKHMPWAQFYGTELATYQELLDLGFATENEDRCTQLGRDALAAYEAVDTENPDD